MDKVNWIRLIYSYSLTIASSMVISWSRHEQTAVDQGKISAYQFQETKCTCTSQEEDKHLMSLVAELGPNQWSKIAREVAEKTSMQGMFESRTGKQCRTRWVWCGCLLDPQSRMLYYLFLLLAGWIIWILLLSRHLSHGLKRWETIWMSFRLDRC